VRGCGVISSESQKNRLSGSCREDRALLLFQR
jgi:hypothetical protein